VRLLHLMSCRGWSSDAYWAARMSTELARRGHAVALGCRASAERVIARARDEGVVDIETYGFAGGVSASDLTDVRRIAARLDHVDLVHVHRGKEHWLAAVANRVRRRPRPLVRTRHIAQAVRPHALNRWLYGAATSLVITVTEAMRRQYVAAGLLPPARVVTLAGGADVEAYRPRATNRAVRRRLAGDDTGSLVGMVGGLRSMKGHAVALEAFARLAADGLRPRLAIVGHGPREAAIRTQLRETGLEAQCTLVGFARDLPQVMQSLDLALYVPLESEGMSRIVFELLASGCPLIAARVGVVPEVLVDGEHALLVPGGDAAALADALGRALADEALRRRLGAAGRCLVEARYSGARVAAALEARYLALGAA
jgi:glycosyltransferase involved in cell wall biosynthesis